MARPGGWFPGDWNREWDEDMDDDLSALGLADMPAFGTGVPVEVPPDEYRDDLTLINGWQVRCHPCMLAQLRILTTAVSGARRFLLCFRFSEQTRQLEFAWLGDREAAR